MSSCSPYPHIFGFFARSKACIDRNNAFNTLFLPGSYIVIKRQKISLLVTGIGSFKNNDEGIFTVFTRFTDSLLARTTNAIYMEKVFIHTELLDKMSDDIHDIAHSIIRLTEQNPPKNVSFLAI